MTTAAQVDHPVIEVTGFHGHTVIHRPAIQTQERKLFACGDQTTGQFGRRKRVWKCQGSAEQAPCAPSKGFELNLELVRSAKMESVAALPPMPSIDAHLFGPAWPYRSSITKENNS